MEFEVYFEDSLFHMPLCTPYQQTHPCMRSTSVCIYTPLYKFIFLARKDSSLHRMRDQACINLFAQNSSAFQIRPLVHESTSFATIDESADSYRASSKSIYRHESERTLCLIGNITFSWFKASRLEYFDLTYLHPKCFAGNCDHRLRVSHRLFYSKTNHQSKWQHSP